MSAARRRVAVAGLGRMGARHAANAALSPRADLAAVCDPRAEVVETMAERLAVPGYADVQELLEHQRVDGLIVATPPSTHGALIGAASERGVHVLCEKPVSNDGRDAATALERAAAAGIVVHVGFQMRFDRDFAELAARVKSGELGRLYQFRASLRDAAPPPRGYLEASGGYFWDGAIHLFDLAGWLMGEITEVTAVGAALSDPVFEEIGDVDNAVAVLRFSSGALGLVETSRVAGYGFESGVEVLGEGGAYRVPGGRSDGLELYAGGTVTRGHIVDFLQRFEPAYVAELDGFVDAIEGKEASAADGYDGLAAMRVCAAAVTAYREHRAVRISEVAW